MKRLNVHVRDLLHAKLAATAKKQGEPMSQIVRRILSAHMGIDLCSAKPEARKRAVKP